MTDPAVFTSQYSMEKEELIKYCDGAPSNTDDFPVVEFSTIVNIAPDTSALKFFRSNQVNYGVISFNDTLNTEDITGIQAEMHKQSTIRNHIIDDLIMEVKRQAREFKLTRNEK